MVQTINLFRTPSKSFCSRPWAIGVAKARSRRLKEALKSSESMNNTRGD
jgi:hypothetical protein